MESIRSFAALFFLILLTSILCSCAMEDERDLCCEEVVLHYLYRPYGEDIYKDNILGLQHFLFDPNGNFVKEIQSNPLNPQVVRLTALPVGLYTVVTLGNVGSFTSLDPPERLQDFLLKVSDAHRSDELFWNVRIFESKSGERTFYICDLSNIHCHLNVRVEWEVMPPYTAQDDRYRLCQEGVGTAYTLSPERIHHTLVLSNNGTPGVTQSDETHIVQDFPLSPTHGEYCAETTLVGMRLYFNMTTLRYTMDHLPVLRLMHGTEQVSPDIQLTKLFEEWGYLVDNHPEQQYDIIIRIKADGNAVVEQWAQASVADWVYGGSFGGSM